MVEMMGMSAGWVQTPVKRNDFQLARQAILSTGWVCSQTVVSVGIVPNHSFLLRVCISFPAGFSAVPSTSAHNVHEMTIGSVVFRVAEGDITKEEGDAIVNITNQTFSLKTGILIDTMWKKYVCLEELGRKGSKYFSSML